MSAAQRIGILAPNPHTHPLSHVFAGVPVLAFDPTAGSPDLDRLGEPDVLLVSVPVPLTHSRTADLANLVAASRAIARRLRAAQLILMTGSVPPGTTRGVVLPLLRESGLVPGKDFLLAYSPLPVDRRGATAVVGGADAGSLEAASALLGQVYQAVTGVSSLEAAELCGVVGAVSQAILMAAANELRILCGRMGADVWEVLDAAGPPWLGGVGSGLGSADPTARLFAWGVRRYGASARLVELAAEVNATIPAFVVGRVTDALNDMGKPVKGSRVLMLGMADEQKKGDAPPQSSGLELMHLLLEKGAVVGYNDPYIRELPPMRRQPELKMRSTPLTEELLAAQDGVLIVADHSDYNYPWIVNHSTLVIDTRNATRDVTAGREKIVRT